MSELVSLYINSWQDTLKTFPNQRYVTWQHFYPHLSSTLLQPSAVEVPPTSKMWEFLRGIFWHSLSAGNKLHSNAWVKPFSWNGRVEFTERAKHLEKQVLLCWGRRGTRKLAILKNNWTLKRWGGLQGHWWRLHSFNLTWVDSTVWNLRDT